MLMTQLREFSACTHVDLLPVGKHKGNAESTLRDMLRKKIE